MSRGMVGADLRPPFMIDVQLNGVASLEHTGLHLPDVSKELAEFLLRIPDLEMGAVRSHYDAPIADLAPSLTVKRRLINDDDAFFALLELFDGLSPLQKRQDLTFGLFGLIAEKFGGAELFKQI